MKKMFILWAPLAIILPIMCLTLQIYNHSSVGVETTPVSEIDHRQILDATIQIFMYPSNSLEVLGIDQQHSSLNEALSIADVIPL